MKKQFVLLSLLVGDAVAAWMLTTTSCSDNNRNCLRSSRPFVRIMHNSLYPREAIGSATEHSKLALMTKFQCASTRMSTTKSFELQMGLLDSMVGGLGRFLESRGNDFVKLDETDQDIVGPGPMLILYRVPSGIGNDEIQDMIHDGAPRAYAQKAKIVRIVDDNDSDTNTILSLSLKQALERLAGTKDKSATPENEGDKLAAAGAAAGTTTTTTPVLYFSGFRNDEMMNVYNILGREVYQESGLAAACAKAVPNAMAKPFRQVLEEICGDHQDAMAMQQQDDGDDYQDETQ